MDLYICSWIVFIYMWLFSFLTKVSHWFWGLLLLSLECGVESGWASFGAATEGQAGGYNSIFILLVKRKRLVLLMISWWSCELWFEKGLDGHPINFWKLSAEVFVPIVYSHLRKESTKRKKGNRTKVRNHFDKIQSCYLYIKLKYNNLSSFWKYR